MLLKSNLQRLLMICFCIYACGSDREEKQTDPAIPDPAASELPKDFIDFYQAFHDDSLYQLEHTIFPLAGLPPMEDSIALESDFHWDKASWKMHKPLNPNLKGYEKTFHKFEDGIIIEKIVQKQVGVGMERRFAKLDDEWILIYYAGMRQL